MVKTQTISQKNKTSFFSYQDAMCSLVENNELIYFGKLEERIQDSVFASKENVYFFCSDQFLYRKNIDFREPMIIFELDRNLKKIKNFKILKKEKSTIFEQRESNSYNQRQDYQKRGSGSPTRFFWRQEFRQFYHFGVGSHQTAAPG